MSFTPSPLQAQAIEAIKDWFQNRTKEQQVFRVFGYAGTGKTTITRHAIAELGLASSKEDCASGGVLYAAFTGKAALVMTRKGTPASTIHSLIYRVSEATREEIEKIKAEAAELRAGIGALAPAERLFAESRLRSIEMRLENAHKPAFTLNTESALRDAKLLVLDEVSMVGEEMARDVLSFGRPVLVLGDPGQLPPVKGEGAFTQTEPDVMLTEVHRQAAESAILRLATLARDGRPIPYGKHDAYVWKMRREEVSAAQMLRGGQVICGRNATRLHLNSAMKREAGFSGAYPSGSGEKIICLKNHNVLGLVNGMFLNLKNIIEDEDKFSFSAEIETEDGVPCGTHQVYKGHFDDHLRFDPEREKRDWQRKRGLIEAVWGWAITCHKAQGSQWENVIVWDDGIGRAKEDRARWLYTAITRAERGLVILD
jgi:exodeoxyribonuclease-5